MGIGISKAGLPGLSLLHVVLFAGLFPGMASTGVVLPMLIAGDLGAVALFRRHARWDSIVRTLPPAVMGVGLGWALMRWSQAQEGPGVGFNPVIGTIVLGLAVLQLMRMWRPAWLSGIPNSRAFAWALGLLAGITTMVANAGGPVIALYLLAVALPKEAFVGTGAWFFLLINLVKVPFSLHLGLITGPSLAFNALLLPVIAAGLLLGRWVVIRLPQRTFDTLILLFALGAAARLLAF
ncbi:MAG: sulfite exporter TauE/SafE family protein [Verrucomicrobiae bacterium]|nr:sulfite exporter TauE/SafE family protein [Verrucomicrobiae bacterium]